MTPDAVTPDVLALVGQSPAVVLAVLVWWELRGMRVDVRALAAAIAVLVDRGQRGE